MEIEFRDWLTIAAIVLGPIFATLIALWMEARRRKQEWRLKQERELLYDLIRARAGFNAPRNRELLESALNAIPFVFHDSPEVIEAYNQAYEAISNHKENGVQRLTELIKVVCERVGYKNVSRETVENIFLFKN